MTWLRRSLKEQGDMALLPLTVLVVFIWLAIVVAVMSHKAHEGPVDDADIVAQSSDAF